MRETNPSPEQSVGALEYRHEGAKRLSGRTRVLLSLAAVVCLLGIGLVASPLIAPSLSRDIVYAHRKSCMAHLRSIGDALRVYADAHGGKYPDSLETLILSGANVRGADFQCTSSADHIPDATTPALLTKQISSLGLPDGFAELRGYEGPAPSRYLSYVYVAPKPTTVTPQSVVLFEPITNHLDRIHVLFGDGSIKSIEQPRAKKFLMELQAGHNPPRAEMLN